MLHKVARADHCIFSQETHASPSSASTHWCTNTWHTASPNLEQRLPGIRISSTTIMDHTDHHYSPSITVLPNPTQMNDAHESCKSVPWHQQQQQQIKFDTRLFQNSSLQGRNQVQSKNVADDPAVTTVYSDMLQRETNLPLSLAHNHQVQMQPHHYHHQQSDKPRHPSATQDMPPILPSLREQLKSIGVSSSFQARRWLTAAMNTFNDHFDP